MLQLYDSRTGRVAPVRPARHPQLRIYLASPAGGDPGQPVVLRGFLLADLLHRVAERHRLQVSLWHNARPALPESAAALNIHPSEFAERPPAPPDIWISTGAQAGHPGAALWARPGQVLGCVAAGTTDPLALRLALLGWHYRQPARLSTRLLTEADQVLSRWRTQVADWANSPSRPMSSEYLARIAAAMDDDLDTPAALREVQALADDAAVQAGAKFETFAYLDQSLGLDLAREVGR